MSDRLRLTDLDRRLEQCRNDQVIGAFRRDRNTVVVQIDESWYSLTLGEVELFLAGVRKYSPWLDGAGTSPRFA